MATTGVFRVPREFKDEDKWFRYFTKKQALILVLSLIGDYQLIMAGSNIGLLLPAIIVSILATMLVVGVVMIELPVDVMFLTGGGITLDQWMMRILIRKHNKVIYTKYMEEGVQGNEKDKT